MIKWLENYEGRYAVDIKGRVWSFKDRLGNFRIKRRKSYLDRYGYPCITLKKDGVCKKIKLHRVIALAFIPNPENKPCINHLDGNKQNYKVDNLQWCTYRENQFHSVHVLGNIPNWLKV